MSLFINYKKQIILQEPLSQRDFHKIIPQKFYYSLLLFLKIFQSF